MPYVTFEMLADAPGARELAEVATPEHEHVCDADKLDHLLRGGDWDTADVAQAQAWNRAEDALRVIAAAQTSADALIDGYLAKKGYRLPLDPCPSLVSQWARSIVRYLLHKDRRTLDDRDPICRNYRDALRLLQHDAQRHRLGVRVSPCAAKVLHLFGSVAGDDGDGARRQRLHGAQHVCKQRLASKRLQYFGAAAFHARTFACGHDDDVKRERVGHEAVSLVFGTILVLYMLHCRLFMPAMM